MSSSDATRILGPLALTGLGVAAGWFLHELATPELSTPVIILQQGQVDREIAPSPGNTNDPELPEITTRISSDSPEPLPEKPTASVKLNIERLLAVGRYDTAMAMCGEVSFRAYCDQAFMDHVQRSDVTSGEVLRLAELWLAEFPDHIEAAMQLVQHDVENERYLDAVNRLAMLVSYQVETGYKHRVVWEARKIAREATIRLSFKDNQPEMRGLLAVLIEMEPDHAAWRFALARTEKEMGNLENALTALTYILYDPEYGERATKMYAEIVRNINLADYVEVPLRKSGRQYLVNVQVNLHQEFSMILDTGASISAIDTGILKSIGFKTGSGRPILLNTAGGQIQARIVKLDSIGVAGQVLTNFDVASLDTAALDSGGLLGVDFLGNFSFVIDDKKRKLYLRRK
jgi:clan AA aspartic protease (TIGR02281 family)